MDEKVSSQEATLALEKLQFHKELRKCKSLESIFGLMGYRDYFPSPSNPYQQATALMELAEKDDRLEELRNIIEQAKSDMAQKTNTLFPTELDRENRRRMMGRVRQNVDSALMKLPESRLTLDMQTQHRKVVTPYGQHDPDTNLPHGKRIIEVYDEQDEALLILGQPGSGKTTLLMEIVRELLDRANNNSRLPFPVVFELSGWPQKGVKLDDWLVKQLEKYYSVHKTIGEPWLKSGAILVFLDGLDEVKEAYRDDCVKAINTYRANLAGPCPMVIGCRRAEYEKLPKLTMHTAVEVLLLTRNQIDVFLQEDLEFEGVRTALKSDKTLYEFMNTPLFLSVVTETFKGRSAEELSQEGSVQERRDRLFKAYVDRMFDNKRKNDPTRSVEDDEKIHENDKLKSKRWLSYMAAKMGENGSQIYLIEGMQAHWLQRKGQILLVKMSVWSVFYIVFNICLKISYGLKGIASMIVFQAGFLIFLGQVYEKYYSARFSNIPARYSWAWKGEGLGGWFMVGTAWGCSMLYGDGKIYKREQVVLVGAIIGIMVALWSCIVPGIPDDTCRANQGITRFAWNAFFASIASLIVGSVIYIISQQTSLHQTQIVFSDAIGTVFSLMLASSCYYGLASVCQHYLLRLLLWRSHLFPRDITSFLDECKDRAIVQRVGGGWRFIHRLLQEYFAEQWKTTYSKTVQDE